MMNIMVYNKETVKELPIDSALKGILGLYSRNRIIEVLIDILGNASKTELMYKLLQAERVAKTVSDRTYTGDKVYTMDEDEPKDYNPIHGREKNTNVPHSDMVDTKVDTKIDYPLPRTNYTCPTCNEHLTNKKDLFEHSNIKH